MLLVGRGLVIHRSDPQALPPFGSALFQSLCIQPGGGGREVERAMWEGFTGQAWDLQESLLPTFQGPQLLSAREAGKRG